MSSKNQIFDAEVFALLLLYCGIAIAQVNVARPVYVAVREDKSGTCFSETNRRQLHSEVKEMFGNSAVPQLYAIGLSSNLPADSCADIYRGHPSDYYWLNVGDQPQQVYCSVNENRCCNGSDGNWMRIAYLNMSDPSQQCPHGWRDRLTNSYMSKASRHIHKLSQLLLSWNSLLQSVWKNHCISIWNSRSIQWL